MPLALLSWDQTRRSEMKIFIVLLFSVLLIAGCSKDRSDDKQVSQTNVEPDNSGRNVQDRDNQNKTSGDQSESEADRTISQNIRAAITSDDSLSTNAKNVKIITSDGTVTLRGPVKSDKERAEIEAKAKQVAGVKRVENQLEIAS
jgi:hyperosmotically inducible periplasmic protein